MNEADLIDEFIDALARNPKAAPPPGLESQTAEFIRALVASERRNTPVKTVQARVWQKALAQTASEPIPHANGNSIIERLTVLKPEAPIDMGDQQMQMTTHLQLSPRPRTERGYGQQMLTLGVAVLLIVLLGGLLLTMSKQTSEPLAAGGVNVQGDLLEANKALFRRYYEEIWGQQNFALESELFAPEYMIHGNDQPAQPMKGVEYFVSSLHIVMPDLKVELHEVLAEGNTVSARINIVGRHLGQLQEFMPPTGYTITVSLTTIVHIADGKISEEWINVDMLGALIQMGAFPNMTVDYLFGIDNPTSASALLKDTTGKVVGLVSLVVIGMDTVELRIDVEGLPPGLHGIHFHEVGICDASGDTPFASAGGHFNPLNREHGLENPNGGGHSGDLPNLEVGEGGSAHYKITTNRITLSPGRNSVLDEDGSAIIIDAMPDDQLTDPDGNSGDGIACGEIGP